MGLRIVMLGPPGAGKGTQAKRIAELEHAPHISTGDIFRAHLSEGTELGKQVQGYLDSGALVPDELTCRIVADRISEPDCQNGYVLDGFPRSLPQAERFSQMLEERGDTLDVAIEIRVPDEEIVERLTARRFCPRCGAIYNLKFDPPPDPDTCAKPDCEGELVQRDDDREETIRQRLKVYHETTSPIIGYYAELGLLRTVEGAGSTPEGVFEAIKQVLDDVRSV